MDELPLLTERQTRVDFAEPGELSSTFPGSRSLPRRTHQEGFALPATVLGAFQTLRHFDAAYKSALGRRPWGDNRLPGSIGATGSPPANRLNK